MKVNVPSATANLVAQNVLLVAGTRELSELVPREAAHLSGLFIAQFSAKGEAFVRRSRKRWFQIWQRIYERLTIPGLALHQVLRKRYIERVVRASLLEGFDQLVILGGGLDSLSLRLHREFPAVNFFELDHPATQQVKQRAIDRERLATGNLKLVPVDFTKRSLEEALKSVTDYSAERRTIFLAEGVLMYLEAREVERILEFARGQSDIPHRLVFTCMETDGKGRASFRRSTCLVRLWLRLRGEPFRWGLKGREMESFLRERSFLLKELATSRTLRENYLRACGLKEAILAEGENVCVCDVAC